MKKLLMLFLVAATALSCSDDGNNKTNTGTIGGLVGTWRLSEMYVGAIPVVITTCDLSNQLKFNADNTVQQTVAVSTGTQCATTTINGVYLVAGNTMTINTMGSQ
ncbi:lipocalin family protein [Nodularia spumigena CS-584]|nr:lipocalin family protein [Nodularia spumigena CS-584]